MWQSFLLPTLTSVIGSWLIILGFWLYNRKRQLDAKTNEYTRLVNEIANLNTKIANASDARENDYTRLTDEIANLNTKVVNASDARENDYTHLTNEMNGLNSKIDNESEARNNHYTHLSNELNNLNSKFDNGFERFFIEIDKLRTNVEANTQKTDFLTSTVDNNIKLTNDLMKIVHDFQNIFHNSVKRT